jgi:hypothetical protein
MTSSTADKEQTPSSTAMSRKRHHVSTPDSEPRSKKLRSRSSNDSALELALDHLRMDPPSHPLYQRNADFIVNLALGDRTMEHAINDQISKVLALADTKGSLDNQQSLALRRQLVLISSQRILCALGASLDEAFDFANWKENFEIQQDADEYKLTFSIRPVMRLDDDRGEESIKPAKNLKAAQSKTKQTSRVIGQVSESHQSHGGEANGESEEDSEDDSEDDDDEDGDSDDSDESPSSGG